MSELSAPLLQIRELNKSYGDLHVLKNVALNVNAGEVVSIIGASGSGKSTFLRCLNVMEMPQSGFMDFEDFSFDFREGARSADARAVETATGPHRHGVSKLQPLAAYDGAGKCDRSAAAGA